MKTMLLALLATVTLSGNSEGLDRLLKGNQRYVEDRLEHPNRTSDRRSALTASQSPFAVIVGCSDSRVAPEIVFDQGIGDLFVVRVAGNVIGPLELDSVEFALVHLKASTVLVLGHENCGAVNAVLQGTTQDIEAIAEKIEPALKGMTGKGNLSEAVRKNAKAVKDQLAASPVVAKLIAEKKVDVAAGYYNLESGKVEILD
jgi:carbonic anhydrase